MKKPLPFELRGSVVVAQGCRRRVPRSRDPRTDEFCRWLLQLAEEWMIENDDAETREEMMRMMYLIELRIDRC